MTIPHNETITRYISSRNDFSKQKGIVKPRVFTVTPGSPNSISVYLISSLTEEEIWHIGITYVQGPNKIKARADFLADCVYQCNLTIIQDQKTHPLHANIPLPLDKEQRSDIYRRLAQASKLVVI